MKGQKHEDLLKEIFDEDLGGTIELYKKAKADSKPEFLGNYGYDDFIRLAGQLRQNFEFKPHTVFGYYWKVNPSEEDPELVDDLQVKVKLMIKTGNMVFPTDKFLYS